MKTLFIDDWKFLRTEIGTTYEDAMDRLQEFEDVEIPHDFQIGQVSSFYKDACGWYYKKFNLEVADKVTTLVFDGLYMNAVVIVNGHKAGVWRYGYSQFILDISQYVKEGENTIMVALRCRYPSARWYTGGGIYRNVWLCQYEKTYIPENGIYLHTQKASEGFLLFVDTEIKREYQDEEELIDEYLDKNCNNREKKLNPEDNVEVFYSLTDTEGNELYQEMIDSNNLKEGRNQAEFLIQDIECWDLDNPVRYILVVELKIKGVTIQKEEVPFGFRDFVFDPEKGFFINGKNTKLNGVCIHHDLGGLGVAYNQTAMKRRLLQLKDMGVNALRLAHNMFDPGVLEMADTMGFLVISEAFDMWEKPKTEYDYSNYFKEWHERDVESWIRRDRNHPCVIMWSIGNEIYDTHCDEHGEDITKQLMNLVELHDPRKNARVTIASNYMQWENAQKCADHYKLAGYNYAESCYEDHHKKYPDWIIYGSETYSIVQSRGIYHFPLATQILSDSDLQCSSLGNSITCWGAESIEACICKDRDTDYSMGQFLWTGYDYLGEPTPYDTKNSYFGLIDTAGFYKDAYYIWKSAWVTCDKDPFVHVFPYWDFNEGQIIDVRVASNAPVVELFLNGKSLGKRTLSNKKGSGMNVLGDYQVAYEPGVIRAVAYDDNGKEIASDEHRSFGDTDSFVVNLDKRAMKEAGSDLVFAEISAIDKDGNPVENAVDRVKVTVEGGKLLALDNGDSADYDSFKVDNRRLFSGKLLAIIKADVDNCSDSDAVKYKVPEVHVEKVVADIPVRKIVLLPEDECELGPDHKTVKVTAKVLPEDATDKELTFKVLNEKCVKSNIAEVTWEGNVATVTALGDGEFVLRCEAKSGCDCVKVMSALNFKVSGVGKAFLDPYDFVPGCMYSSTVGQVGSGNEQGVATGRETETVVTYSGVDFGVDGSDTITMPIFPLTNDSFPIEIWDGVPGEAGAELIGDVVYDKGMIWNTYQDVTYKLDKVLVGLKTMSFKVNQKMHLKGFSFERQLRALRGESVLNADSIYGDSFTKKADSVEGIGNNVTITFDEMELGSEGVTEVVVTGRATQGANTIHLRMKNDSEETKEILEFPKTSEYKEISFPIDKKSGSWSVSFVFLPGSNFDFKSFRFE